jgi:CCR4-NOT transcription complex subunit 1
MNGRPPPPSQDPSFNSTVNNPSSSTSRNTRAQQPPWQATSSAARQFTRRGLTPISTATSGLPSSATSSLSRAAFSPTRLDPIQSASIANRQVASRQSSGSSTHSFGGISATSQHPNYASVPSQSGPRTRTVASGSSPRVTSPISGVSALSQSGSVGVGISRLARHSPSISAAGSPVSASGPYSASGSSGQLTSLVVTQLNILLSTIKDDGDSAKWQAQVNKIQRLVEDNGMEVFPQYFRRLLQNNASAIFPSSGRQSTETATAGNYQLLVQEMQKISIEAQQATQIAEALDTSESELFRDFDLYALMDHFRLDPVARVTLALACRKVSKADLRSKGKTNLSSPLFKEHTLTCHFNHSRCRIQQQPFELPPSPRTQARCCVANERLGRSDRINHRAHYPGPTSELG